MEILKLKKSRIVADSDLFILWNEEQKWILKAKYA